MPRCYLRMAQRIGINKDPGALMQLDLRDKGQSPQTKVWGKCKVICDFNLQKARFHGLS